MSNSYSAKEAIAAVEEHRVSRGGNRSAWYAGIAKDPEQRLFNDHNVDKGKGHWRWLRCIDEDHARTAEAALLDAGYQGGPGGGNHLTKYVYAYRITSATVEG